MNENENLQDSVPSTGRKINTDRIKRFNANTDALEGALAKEAEKAPIIPEAPKRAPLRVVGSIPHPYSAYEADDKENLNPQPIGSDTDLDDDFFSLTDLDFGRINFNPPTPKAEETTAEAPEAEEPTEPEEVEESIGIGGEDPIKKPIFKGINFSAIKESIKAKLANILKRKPKDDEVIEVNEVEEDEEPEEVIGTPKSEEVEEPTEPEEVEEDEEPEVKVTATEDLPEKDKKHRRGCGIIAGLTIGAIIVLIGGRKVVKWLNERAANTNLNTTPEATMSPEAEPVPDDALVNPEDLVDSETTATPVPEETINPEEVAAKFYGYLQECEAKGRENASTIQVTMDSSDNEYSAYEEFSFILPNGKDTILDMYYALHPELGVSSTLSIDEVITLCNQIAANCHHHYLKSNLSMLLQGCDEQIIEKIDRLDDLAASIKLENYDGDFKEGLYTSAEEESAKAAGANITQGNLFFTNLEAIYENLPTDDVNNIPIYCVLDAFYTGVANKIPTYINHFTTGANSSIAYLLKDEEMLNEENYQKFYAPHNTETLPKIDETTIASSTNDYFTLLSNYEKEYNIKFNNVTKENVDKLYNYFNGLEIMSPEEAYNLCFEISTVCKANNINPKFEMLLNNTMYSNMIKEYYNKISVLKVDYDPSDDKLLYSYLGENIATGTGMINYNDPKQNSLFVLIKAIFDSYKAETLYYVNVGKNGEFYVNGDVYYSCAMGIRDAINEEYEAIVETYERDATLKKSR